MERVLLEVRLYGKYMWRIHRIKRGLSINLGRICILLPIMEVSMNEQKIVSEGVCPKCRLEFTIKLRGGTCPECQGAILKKSPNDYGTYRLYEQNNKCPDCWGSGKDYGVGGFDTDFADCPTCNGPGEKELDSTKEKIAQICWSNEHFKNYSTWEEAVKHNQGSVERSYKCADQILALIEPLIKDAREQERERIFIEVEKHKTPLAWGLCDWWQALKRAK